MRKSLTTSLAVLLLSTSGQASFVQASYAAEQVRAPRWHKFCADGVVDVLILADRAEASLRKDPTGKTRIEGCRATPLDFYSAHVENHEDSAPSSVGDVPRYYREDVELTVLPQGTKYWSACKTNTGYIGQCHLRVAGAGGERVWRHKKTLRVVLLGNCANPAGKPEVPAPKEACDSRFIYLRPGEENRIGMAGRTKLVKSACLGIRRAGEKEFTGVLLDECLRNNCNYEASARGLGLPVRPELQVSYVAEQEGWYELRFDATQLSGDNAIIDCVIKVDGTQSLGMVTTKAQMYSGVTYLSVVPKDKLSASFVAPIRVGAYVRPVLWTNTKVSPPVRK